MSWNPLFGKSEDLNNYYSSDYLNKSHNNLNSGYNELKKNDKVKNLNRSFSSKVREPFRKTSENKKGLVRLNSSEDDDPCGAALYNLESKSKVYTQMGNLNCNDAIRETFKQTYDEMRITIENLKNQVEETEKDNLILKDDLNKANADLIDSNELVERKETELKSTKVELERRIVNNASSTNYLQEQQQSLLKFKTACHKLEYAKSQNEKELQEAKKEVVDLKVKGINLEQEVAELKTTNDMLCKTLVLHDTAITAKVLNQDDKLRKMTEDHQQVKDYAAKVVGLFEDMSSKQEDYLDKFNRSANLICSMEDRTRAFDERIRRLEAGPVSNIDRNLNRMNETLVEVLKDEIGHVQDNREHLRKGNDNMTDEHTKVQKLLVDRLNKYGRDIESLKDVSQENYKKQLPMYVSAFCIGIIVLLIIQHLVYIYR